MEFATTSSIYRQRADFAVEAFESAFAKETKRKHETLFNRCLRSLIDRSGQSTSMHAPMSSLLWFTPCIRLPTGRARQPNFWQRLDDPVRAMREGKGLVFHRDEVQRAVGMYLDLPVRSSLMDRTLVDILISMEMYAYGGQVFSGWHPVSLKKVLPNVAGRFFGGQLGYALVLGGVLLLYAFLTGVQLSHDMIAFAAVLWASTWSLRQVRCRSRGARRRWRTA